ncbi:hypothetical protein, conserved [Leishmania tarentolae]|uniref:Uncharacterized protein n=1 Tax=Leishmania tarentolae TaxID=5689 RepID=A0A640KCX3_LEITA|nr:hypothetical protein, conserved [Leishmania tarentolae]
MRSLASLRFAALLTLFTLCGIVKRAEAVGLPGVLILQIKGYTSFSSSTLVNSGISVSYSTTESVCFNTGGVPASDANTRLSNSIAYWMKLNNGAEDSTVYVGSSAKPSLPNTKCAERAPGFTSPNSDNCYYRWRYGFYDMYSYEGEPGTAFWAGLYLRKDGTEQILNQFQQFVWSPDHIGKTPYPRGYYGGIASYSRDTQGLFRMDGPLVPTENNPFPRRKYMIVCEYQLYPERPPSTTPLPQPVFVNGFKELTWAQSNWWVLFLVCAICVLCILFYIVAYCCITSVKPKEEPPLFQMVIRERVGKAYVVNNELPTMVHQQNGMPSFMPQDQQPLTPEEVQRRQMRYGRGFNPNQPGEQVDMTMGAAGIYSGGDRRQYTGGAMPEDSVGNFKMRNFGMNETDPSPEGAQSDMSGANDSDSIYRASCASLPKRRSGRGRNLSQSFADIELPRAGEINEKDVDL